MKHILVYIFFSLLFYYFTMAYKSFLQDLHLEALKKRNFKHSLKFNFIKFNLLNSILLSFALMF